MENYPEIAKYVVGNIKFNVIRSPILPIEPYNDPGYFNEIFKAVTYSLLLGLIFLLVYTVLRTTVRTKKDIRNNLNIKCLGIVPQIILKKNSKDGEEPLLITTNLTDDRFPDSIRSLRILLNKMFKNDKKVIAITSTIAEEGKTTVCVNMALSFALIGKKVLVADFDTNNSGVLKTLRVNEDELKYSIVTDKYKIAYLDKYKIYVMKLISDGDKKEALNNDNLSTIFSSLKVDYDLIFVDTAPCATDSDALFVAQESDGVLYVILQDTVRISKIKEGMDSLNSTDTEILGCVLNGAQTSIMGYGYYKAYNKYGYYKSYGKYGKYSKYGGKYGKYGKYGGAEEYGFSFEDSAES
jgi:capsular exopolysaccharide synthesis family protein